MSKIICLLNLLLFILPCTLISCLRLIIFEGYEIEELSASIKKIKTNKKKNKVTKKDKLKIIQDYLKIFFTLKVHCINMKKMKK